MSTFWIIAIILSGIGFISALLYFSINLFFYYLSLSRRSITRAVIQKKLKEDYDKFKFDFGWFDTINCETLSLKSKDGHGLVANYYKQKDDNKLAIICHGYGADFREMGLYAKYFYKNGYSLLLPQFRAHGESEGKTIGMGWPDRIDLKKWINHMVKINPNYKIVLFGLSMGASTVCMTVGEELPKNVKCAISDCGYANAYDQFMFVTKKLKIKHAKTVMLIYNNFLTKLYGINLKKFDAVKQVKKAQIPMLFIHGEEDEFVSFENLQILYEAYPKKTKSKYECKGASHAMSYPSHEEEYENHLNTFLKKHFN